MRAFILALIISFSSAPAFASTHWADEYQDFDLTQPLPMGEGAGGSNRKFSGTIGLGLLSAPEYQGATDNELRFLPVIDVEVNRKIFLSTQRGAGFYVFRDNRFALATMVNVDWGRDESDNPRLRGLGDLDPTAQIGADMKWHINNNFSFDADVYQAISPGGHEGAYGNVGFGSKFPLSRSFVFRANTGIRWASDAYMSREFGVNAAQSSRSGLSAFNPDSTLMSWQFGAAVDFNMGRRFTLSPNFRYVALQGDAADSPVTQDDAQYYMGVNGLWRF